METLKKSQTLYPIFSFIFFMIALILSIFVYFYQTYFLSLFVIVLLIIGIISYAYHLMRLKRLLSLLIQTSSNIIDRKPIEAVIDGESQIAVLSSHLSILDTRMKAMIERLNKEQLLLKDYIEDISHQIKTPLTSMILREEMLLEMIDEGKEREIVLSIYHQTEKIKDLIESLLHLARIESHSIEYDKKEYDFKDILEHINDILAPLKEKYDVQVIMDNVDYSIYCDERWMSEAIENIIKNCIEQKEHSTVDIHCQKYSSYIEIYIQDHGNGFDEEDMPHIFERFYQGKSRKGKGIGIGLALSKGIVDDHHGCIEISNHDGALFKIILPYKNTKSKYTVTK